MMAMPTEAIFLNIPPQEVLLRVSQSIADERQALLHPFATKEKYMGTVQSNGFYILPKGGFRRNTTRCTGVVDSNGSASRVSLSFNRSSSTLFLLLGIALAISLVGISITVAAVLFSRAPSFAIGIAVALSTVLIVIMSVVGFAVKLVSESKQQAMIVFLEWVFRGVRISP